MMECARFCVGDQQILVKKVWPWNGEEKSLEQ